MGGGTTVDVGKLTVEVGRLTFDEGDCLLMWGTER